MLGKPPRVFSLGKTIAVILFIEIKVRRVAAGRGKEHVSIGQAELSKDDAIKGKMQLL